MTGLEWLGVVATVIGVFTPFALYFKGRMNTLQDNHLAHIQAAIDRLDEKFDNFILTHLTGHK